jgi:predicted nucleic acid-binding protein
LRHDPIFLRSFSFYAIGRRHHQAGKSETIFTPDSSCYSPSDLSLSTITLAEIYYGIEKLPVKKKERRLKIEYIKSELDIFPFNEQAAVKYGAI